METMSGKELADALANSLNAFNTKGFNEEFARTIRNQHRTLQQNIMRSVLEVIKCYADAYKNNLYDLRNEASVKLCHEIVEAFEDKFYLPMV